MSDTWIVEGSISINGVVDAGPVRILRGDAETWVRTPRQGDRKHLSLLCVDRRMLLGAADDRAVDVHLILPVGGRSCVGYHMEVHGHPADNERVTRNIPRIDAGSRYSPTSVHVVIQADTLAGERSRDDDFRPDTSPWTIRVLLDVPRKDARAIFALSDEDGALVEHRFDGA